VQPLICYESLFPGLARGGGDRPLWIVNASNDSWFGRTSGPWQHLNIASYRAIEQGTPIVRATSTGVSAVIDAYGRPLRKLGVGEQGVIDAALPPVTPPTLYSRFGDAIFWALAILGLLGPLALSRTAKYR
jgi:apolipoprotein N-acyltransferase